MSENTKEQRELTIEAERIEGQPLFLRTPIAEAKGDGFRVEIAANVGGGAVLVTYNSDDSNTWVTYALTPTALVDAALALEKP